MALEQMMTNQDKHCKKTCKVKEFQVIRESSSLSGSSLSRVNIVDVFFELPDATRGFMSKTPYITVNMEHFLISDLALLGNVGGILGIFVGFSFLGITELLMSVGETMWKRLRKTTTNITREAV